MEQSASEAYGCPVSQEILRTFTKTISSDVSASDGCLGRT
jgi:hypothetical protein